MTTSSSIKWRKGELIGSGAFGRVFMGMDTQSGALIAAKEADTKAIQEEVELHENLSHPKIVRYLGREMDDETVTILLEYVPGGSVQSLLEKFGSFSVPVIRRYTKQLLLGLEYLHRKGIVHGDIKGANILVDNKGRIKLADFGTSKQAASSCKKITRGTAYWMAPEVVRGTGHNFSADIWSVGCTVIEMATGSPPWNNHFETVAAFFYFVGTTKSHPPIPEHLPSSVKEFLQECLQKEPNLRPSASELLKHCFLTGKQETSLSYGHTTSMEISSSQGSDEVINPIMELEVGEVSLACETQTDEIEGTWSYPGNDSCFGTKSTTGANKHILSNLFNKFKRLKRTKSHESTEGNFSYSSIKVATCNFSAENKLGEGGFGSVYKGILESGKQVAVKRLSISSRQGTKEFKNEMRFIRELQHRNIVQILGSCMHGDERILIYELMPNFSLDNYLHDSAKSCVLSEWKKRFKLIEGIAQGLVYLHEYSRFRVVHRDIKVSNILLDECFNPKISDFGLSRILTGDHKKAKTNRICGTLYYMSPEYAMCGIFGVKSDVFSFGVVMLEILIGRRNSQFRGPFYSIQCYARELWKKGAGLELMDPMLRNSSINKDQFLRCLHVGLLCVEENADDRPTMSDAIFMMKCASLKLPVPKCSAIEDVMRGNESKTLWMSDCQNMIWTEGDGR